MCLLLIALSLVAVPVACADSVCGDPPPVANESLRAEIEGQAKLLSRRLGSAELSGEIRTRRDEIFSKYPDAEKSRSNAYFEYQICVLVMGDDSMSNKEKLEELKKVRREFSHSGAAAKPPVAGSADQSDPFHFPQFGGYRLDWCLDGASLCGKPAADAWCKEKGYGEAVYYKQDPDIGASSPTKVLRDGGVCREAFCDGFEVIICGHR